MKLKYIHIIGKDNRYKAKEIGNKAFNIERLLSNKIPVPKGFCLKCSAFEDLLKFNNITFDPNGLNNIKARQIRTAIRSAKMPNKINEELDYIFRILNENVAHGWIARSSSPLEDSQNLAFAGIFDSIAGLFSFEELIDGIKNCWASAFNDRLLSYATQNNLIGFHGFAVLMQPLVLAEKSGVVFTQNPISKKEDRMLIEGTFGLGELLVSGKITPDSWEVEKNTYKIIFSRVGTKKRRLCLNTKNKLVEINTPKEEREKLSLSNAEITELSSIVQNIEKTFNVPQDIEWVVSKGKFWIVQSRPISNLNV